MTTSLHGFFNMDKAAGITSMDVVRKVKRLTGMRHVGHAGTLDPEATGVLPVCLGQATRLMQMVVDGHKEYLATVRLGVTTDTYDAAGQVLDQRDPSGVTEEALLTALSSMKGEIRQTPPAYSALKQQGRRLHELARAGVRVEPAPRMVEVVRLELTLWQPPVVTLAIECGRGFYVRSLAHDLGQSLGCGAHLSGLRRLRTGPFRIEQAVSLEQLSQAMQDGTWSSLLYQPDYVVLSRGAVTLDAREEKLVRNGQGVALSPRTHYAPHLQECMAYNAQGVFLALLKFNRADRVWQPFKVFQLDTPSPYREQNPLG